MIVKENKFIHFNPASSLVNIKLMICYQLSQGEYPQIRRLNKRTYTLFDKKWCQIHVGQRFIHHKVMSLLLQGITSNLMCCHSETPTRLQKEGKGQRKRGNRLEPKEKDI